MVGRKYIRLYSPDETKYLYPHQSQLLHNTSQVKTQFMTASFLFLKGFEIVTQYKLFYILWKKPHDCFTTTRWRWRIQTWWQFPDFSKASYQECVLRPRDVLFIPQKHWHYVRSLELSFSVSFWWSWFLRNKTACVVKSCIAFICTNANFLRFRLLYAYINVSLTVNDGVIIQYCH